MLKKIYKPAAIAFALALVLSGCASKVAIEKPLSDLAKYESQKLDWSTCYDNFQCTELLVPIDYADLTVGTFKISVLRYQAQDQKKSHRLINR